MLSISVAPWLKADTALATLPCSLPLHHTCRNVEIVMYTNMYLNMQTYTCPHIHAHTNHQCHKQIYMCAHNVNHIVCARLWKHAYPRNSNQSSLPPLLLPPPPHPSCPSPKTNNKGQWLLNRKTYIYLQAADSGDLKRWNAGKISLPSLWWSPAAFAISVMAFSAADDRPSKKWALQFRKSIWTFGSSSSWIWSCNLLLKAFIVAARSLITPTKLLNIFLSCCSASSGECNWASSNSLLRARSSSVWAVSWATGSKPRDNVVLSSKVTCMPTYFLVFFDVPSIWRSKCCWDNSSAIWRLATGWIWSANLRAEVFDGRLWSSKFTPNMVRATVLTTSLQWRAGTSFSLTNSITHLMTDSVNLPVSSLVGGGMTDVASCSKALKELFTSSSLCTSFSSFLLFAWSCEQLTWALRFFDFSSWSSCTVLNAASCCVSWFSLTFSLEQRLYRLDCFRALHSLLFSRRWWASELLIFFPFQEFQFQCCFLLSWVIQHLLKSGYCIFPVLNDFFESLIFCCFHQYMKVCSGLPWRCWHLFRDCSCRLVKTRTVPVWRQ